MGEAKCRYPSRNVMTNLASDDKHTDKFIQYYMCHLPQMKTKEILYIKICTTVYVCMQVQYALWPSCM